MSDLRLPPIGHEPLPEGEEAPPPGVRVAAAVRWAIIIAMAAIAGASVLHYAGVLRPSTEQAAGVQYYCPMHPSVVQDHPGECPICNMTLVERPVTARPDAASSAAPAGQDAHRAPGTGEHPAPGAASGSDVPGLVALELPPERVQLIGMRTAPVVRGQLASELRTVGYVAANEAGRAQVHTRFAGWIEDLRVADPGARVERGDVLASIYSPTLVSTQQELMTARAWRGIGTTDGDAGRVRSTLIEGARRRLELAGIAPEDVRRIERNGAVQRALPIRAPTSGYVVEKAAVQGQYVEPGTKLFELADLSTVWVWAEVYEHEVSRVREGAETELTLAAHPGRTWTGRVDLLFPTLDPATRTLRVRLVFSNPDVALRPGMYGDVVVHVPPKDTLLAPREAIVDTGEHRYVFLARDGGRFEPRLVTTGARAEDQIEILSGVRDGDVVVTTASFLLDSESRLRAAITSGGGGTAPVHAH